MRSMVFAGLSGTLILLAAACSPSDKSSDETPQSPAATPTTIEGSPATTSPAETRTSRANAPEHDDPADYEWDESREVTVTLNGTAASADDDAVAIEGSTVTITSGGNYRVAGALADGQLVVDASGDDLVRLILDGVNIANTNGAALSVKSASKVVVLLAGGSHNLLEDAQSYTFPDTETDEPNAVLFSTADLTIAGDGSLVVRGNFNDGIASKDGLVISGGNVTVMATDDGIRGKDYIVLKGGTIAIEAGGDGLKADNEEDAALGYVTIEKTSLTIAAGGDGIDAATDVVVESGTLAIATGGGAKIAPSADVSSKGVKGKVSVTIDGGDLNIDASDDAIHSNDSVTINNGDFEIVTGDDAVHGDTTVTINGGTIDIGASYEGVESAGIVINGGVVSIISSDDGLNAAGGRDGSGVQGPGVPGGRPAPDGFGGATGDYSITINGGTVLVSSLGDGIDANGTLAMSGGTVVVQGPTVNMNGAIDYDGSFVMSGGTLVAAGSAGMAQGPGTGSTQASVHVLLQSPRPGGTVIHVESSDGKAIATITIEKAFQSLVISAPELVAGTDYKVSIAGGASGESLNGLHNPGAASAGEPLATVTATLAVARVGRR